MIGAPGVLFGVLLVPTAVVASDTLDFVAGDLLDVGPLPEAEAPPQNSFVYASDGSLREVYVARVTLSPSELQRVPGFTPTPGMPAEIMIQTAERTFAQYLVKPIKDSLGRAFREQ